MCDILLRSSFLFLQWFLFQLLLRAESFSGWSTKNNRTVASEDLHDSQTHTRAYIYTDKQNKTGLADETCLRRPYKDSQQVSHCWSGAPAEPTAGNTGEQTPLLTHTHTHSHTPPTALFVLLPWLCWGICEQVPTAERRRQTNVAMGVGLHQTC